MRGSRRKYGNLWKNSQQLPRQLTPKKVTNNPWQSDFYVVYYNNDNDDRRAEKRRTAQGGTPCEGMEWIRKEGSRDGEELEESYIYSLTFLKNVVYY